MTLRAIGLMSGTSCDGVDALMLELQHPDRRHVPRVLGHVHHAFDDALQDRLRAPERLGIADVSALGYLLAQRYADAVRELPQWESAQVVGMHGQTVWHCPPSRAGGGVSHTLQLGSSGALAQALRLPVVGDLRAADVALGGEGAPIAPIAHWMFTPPDHAGRLVINVGGIANVTLVTESCDDVLAGDVGPGMMITDALARHVTGGSHAYDRDGTLSTGGQPIPAVVEEILAHPFFSRPLPRSTGREDFGADTVAGLLQRHGHEAGADLIASSLEATARAIVRAATEELPGVTELVLTGGGALHPGLRARVQAMAAPRPVVVHHDGPLAPQHHEPAAMALIAARTLHRLPSSLPRVTGARGPAVLGHVCWPGGQPGG
ncbi:anhydro-N-acetylmuramic acid kinase [Paraliomyxa miuraensis]|uniref:anhydro-N-acetylmuramic acid kinase n=1 Tax=Paraliomyxa miuraensis TaxID=376150 RepID=UPI00224D93A3|nr:anhydro-N-acetylmuramic acid kinase [Paraliomyxa miuraensis]MCX4240686.1 anhydro-N-acetylmuramic acid kinase [Paraliomyxa miuraensis]